MKLLLTAIFFGLAVIFVDGCFHPFSDQLTGIIPRAPSSHYEVGVIYMVNSENGPFEAWGGGGLDEFQAALKSVDIEVKCRTIGNYSSMRDITHWRKKGDFWWVEI